MQISIKLFEAVNIYGRLLLLVTWNNITGCKLLMSVMLDNIVTQYLWKQMIIIIGKKNWFKKKYDCKETFPNDLTFSICQTP